MSNENIEFMEDEEIFPPRNHKEEAMPTFFHIGVLAKECLIRGYKFGIWRLDTSTESRGFMLKSYGAAKPNKNTILAGLEIRKKFSIFEVVQAWQNDQMVSSEFIVCNKINSGHILTSILTTFGIKLGQGFKAMFRLGFERRPINLELILPLVNEPKLMGYILVQPARNWILACRTIFDMEFLGFAKHAFCLGYSNGKTEVGIKLENFKDLRFSIFRRFGDRWAFAFKTNLYEDAESKCAIGGQYQLSSGAVLKAKIREDFHLGLIYNVKLGDNIDITYHFSCEMSQPVSPKLGVA